jgi:hypothetical protein
VIFQHFLKFQFPFLCIRTGRELDCVQRESALRICRRYSAAAEELGIRVARFGTRVRQSSCVSKSSFCVYIQISNVCVSICVQCSEFYWCSYDDCAPATSSSGDPAPSVAAHSETAPNEVSESSASQSPLTVAAVASSLPPSQSAAPAAFHLALRKWSNLLPSREFRCFVIDRQLVGALLIILSDYFFFTFSQS